MNPIVSLIGFLGLCLLLVGVILVAVLYLIVRRNRESISDLSSRSASASDSISQTSGNEDDTRWSRGNLKATPSTPPVPEDNQPCPACGAPNPRSARVCASCGSKLK